MNSSIAPAAPLAVPGDAGILSPRQIMAILRARQRLVLGVALTIFFLTVLVSLFMPKVWTASTDIYIDYRENDPIAVQRLSAMLDDSYMQTQLDLLKSQRVAETVVKNLNLHELPDYRIAASNEGEEKASQQLIERLMENVEIQRLKGSRVVTIAFNGRSPEQARDYADAIAKAYIDLGEQMSFIAARSRFEQYNAQLEQLRKEVDTVQNNLTAYQQENDILNVQEHGDQDTQRLNELNKTLISLQSALQEARARSDATRRMLDAGFKPDEIPMVNETSVINMLKSQLGYVDRQMGDRQGSLGPNHPSIRGLAAERGQLLARIAKEAEAILTGADSNIMRLSEQIADVENSINQLRNTVLTQMAQRDQIATFQRRLAGAQQVYNAALQKYDSLVIASNVTLPNVTVLRSAELPSSPSKPDIRVNLILGLLVGLFVALALALLLELLSRRVRIIEDMTGDPELPLIGHIGLQEVLT